MSFYFDYQARCVLRVSGPDASEFLQGQFSNDLSRMEIGGAVYGLWLNRKGKIVADSFVLRRADEDYLLISYYCDERVVFDRLDSYLIMEDVELEGLSTSGSGRCVFEDFSTLGATAFVPEKGRFVDYEGVVIFWGRRSSEPCLEVVAVSDIGRASLGKVAEALSSGVSRELSADDIALKAIHAKVPRIGVAFGEADLPQELGLDVDAVSFNKGCYLGQEVMARLHAMGKVRKEMKLFSVGKMDTKNLPIDLTDENGKRQGSLRELAYSNNGALGLGVINVSFAGGELRAGEASLQVT